ncbi:MAG: aromatic hydrocarbon degradation protein, partial [Perlucidibaca sp.]
MSIRNLRWLPMAALTLSPVAGHAAMGQIATNFGLLPQDVASAQALSMFSNDPSVTYYNPAYLAKDRKGALTAGFLYTKQELTAKDWNTPDDVVTGDVIEDRSNYNILLGMKTDLSQMLKSERPLVLGLMLGAERTGNRLLSFSSTTSQTAQPLRYGQQSLFLSLGAGLNVVPGFDVGASTRITLAASADLSTYTDLSGNTLYESISVSAKPNIQPILSGNLDWGRLVCPSRRGCWLTGLETSLSWRYESAFETEANALAVVPNLLQGLPLALATIDSYQPETWSAAMQYNMYKLRLAAGVDYQLWSGLNDK